MQNDWSQVNGQMSNVHKSVLLQEVIDGLDLKANDVIVDGTVGNGGHSEAIAKYLSGRATIVGLDLDRDSLARSTKRLEGFNAKFSPVLSNYRDMDKALADLNIKSADKIILDLGWSSDQFKSSGRGFSFQTDEPLLMTLSADPKESDLTALEVVNTFSEDQLVTIFRNYGEEKSARPIAQKIIEARSKEMIRTSGRLAGIIESAVPNTYRYGRIHPATRTFQAIRIAVNDELNNLKEGINKAMKILSPGGRLAIISFHSLEDRIVKQTFRELEKEGLAENINKKPIIPSDQEIKENPRSRSAKLRIIQKI